MNGENPYEAEESGEPAQELDALKPQELPVLHDETAETGGHDREESECSEQPPFRYSESGYVMKDGRMTYVPERITGVYEEALEDPRCSKTVQELAHWQFQGASHSCVVACENMAINDLMDESIPEARLREFSAAQGWYREGVGTYPEDIGRIAEQAGLVREQPEAMTMEELMEAKAEGRDLIVGVDAMLLRQPYLSRTCKTNHVVEVIGFDVSDAENPKVIVNDTVRLNGRGEVYPFEVFKRAACRTDPETGKQTLQHVTMLSRREDRA